MDMSEEETYARNVTILILIDGFLQLQFSRYLQKEIGSHNPYFNRWFSAIWEQIPSLYKQKESQSLF